MATPSEQQVELWEAVAKGKIRILRVLADEILTGESASSGYLRAHCGLSADEWHGAGELIAAVICFAADKGFLEWHAAGMSEIEPAAAMAEEEVRKDK